MRKWRAEHPRLVEAFRHFFCPHLATHANECHEGCVTQEDRDLVNDWVSNTIYALDRSA